jgi:hypothetical protein
MATTVEAVCNQALKGIGARERIADMYEGSAVSIVAIELYGQARDELLRSKDWAFASANGIPLTLLKGPPPPGGYNPAAPWTPLYPPPGYLYEYAYPGDCLDLRAIQFPAGMLPVLDPRSATWRVVNDLTPVIVSVPGLTVRDAIGPPAKVVLTNVAKALCTYRRQVINPQLWEPGFVKALVASLEEKFAPSVANGWAVERAKLGEAMADASGASGMKG